MGAQNGDVAGVRDNDRATTRVAPTLGDVIGAFKSITTTEQTIGRGLRLPYGERTGVDKVDKLTI